MPAEQKIELRDGMTVELTPINGDTSVVVHTNGVRGTSFDMQVYGYKLNEKGELIWVESEYGNYPKSERLFSIVSARSVVIPSPPEGYTVEIHGYNGDRYTERHTHWCTYFTVEDGELREFTDGGEIGGPIISL